MILVDKSKSRRTCLVKVVNLSFAILKDILTIFFVVSTCTCMLFNVYIMYSMCDSIQDCSCDKCLKILTRFQSVPKYLQ